MTPDMWWDLPDYPAMVAAGKYRFHFDDFTEHGTFADATEEGGILTDQDTGVTFITSKTSDIGELVLAGADATQDFGVVTKPTPLVKFEVGRKLWFEMRVKKEDVTDDTAAFYGLAWNNASGSEAPVDGTLLADTSGALLTGTSGQSIIGFHVDIAAASTVDFVHGAEGQTPIVAEAGIATLVADTYMKLGFKYDPGKNESSGLIEIWIDGTAIATKEVTSAIIAGATFPTDEVMTPAWVQKIVGTANTGGAIDWWAVCQELAS
jgi:hypothetical protein